MPFGFSVRMWADWDMYDVQQNDAIKNYERKPNDMLFIHFWLFLTFLIKKIKKEKKRDRNFTWKTCSNVMVHGNYHICRFHWLMYHMFCWCANIILIPTCSIFHVLFANSNLKITTLLSCFFLFYIESMKNQLTFNLVGLTASIKY